MIASDDNNPHFTGAHNPDDRLHVVFYKKTLPNEFESKKQGHPIFYECDFVKINLPGNQLNNVDDFVNDTHKQRFPRQWAHYLNSNKEGSEVIGTPIAEWPLITRSQAEELRALKFYSVESIANASDQQLQSLGMKAGMQPHAFRDRARNYLASASREATAAADLEAKTKAEAELKETRDALDELRAQMAELQANTPRVGRPKKTETA